MKLGFLRAMSIMSFFIELPMEKNKTILSFFEEDGKKIEGDDNLLEHATIYYYDLFGPACGN
jgi:hypothetical protein